MYHFAPEHEPPHIHPKVVVGVFVLLGLCAFLTTNLGVARSTAQGLPPAALTVVAEPARAPVVLRHEAYIPVTRSTHVLFVGDMFFDRQIRFVGDMYGRDYPFTCVDPLLKSADMVVGNLEGPVTDNPSVSLGSVPGSTNNYKFTFPTTTPEVLLRHNVKAVSIGNNHMLNFGYDGLSQTHHHLALAGLDYFGGVKGSEPVDRLEQNDVKISLVGFNQFGGSSAEEVAKTVASEKAEGRVVIVFAHWGTEYSTTTDETRLWATLFAESGASAVIGAHPHVVGVHEQIGSTPVYYSLGNFIFDQYFSVEVTHGLAVMLTITPGGVVDVQEHPVVLERSGQTCEAK